MEERSHALQERMPVSLILAISMVAAGVVYPVADSAPEHTSPIVIASPARTRGLWAWHARSGSGTPP